MKNRIARVLFSCCAAGLLAAGSAGAATPFRGIWDVLIVVADGSGDVTGVTFFDCWDFRQSGAIRPVPGASVLVSGGVDGQEPETGNYVPRAEYRVQLAGAKMRGNLLFDTKGGQKVISGTMRGKAQPSGLRLVGTVSMVPALRGGSCGIGTRP